LVEETEDRLGKDQSYLLDSSKLRDELTWSDKISLEAGIKKTLTWVDDNLSCLSSLPMDYQHKP
jgi:dTDP-glucose 4,6-dehydratase